MPGLHRAKCVAKKKGRKEGGRCFPSSRTLSNYPLLPSILHVGVARGDVLMCCEDWCVLTAACLDTDTSVCGHCMGRTTSLATTRCGLSRVASCVLLACCV